MACFHSGKGPMLAQMPSTFRGLKKKKKKRNTPPWPATTFCFYYSDNDMVDVLMAFVKITWKFKVNDSDSDSDSEAFI